MGCNCGGKSSTAVSSTVANPSAVQFEHTGKTRLIVISPTTGISYSFRPGLKLPVDPRDQEMMLKVPDLRPVSSASAT